MMGQVTEVAVVDQSSRARPHASLGALCAAMQLWMRRDVCPAWGFFPGFAVSPADAVPAARPAIVLVDDADAADALGYHEVTAAGYPLGKVFTATAQSDPGGIVSVTLAHELAELAGDPYCQLMAWGSGSTIYSMELCDAVEEELYDVGGITVSDFVLPSWFGWPLGPHGRYDFLGRLKAPWELMPGGYAAVIEGGQEKNLFGSREKAERFAREDRRGHRTEAWRARARGALAEQA